jgi:uncharacterized protein (TIGR00255 family)
MTGYAAQTRELPSGVLGVELRAVNSRFLDLVFRINEDFRVLEPTFRERIAEAVRRGKLECRLNHVTVANTRLPDSANRTLLAQLRGLSAQIREAAPDAQPMSVTEILRWPGVLAENTPDPETLHAVALELLAQALREFNASRAREGAKLKAVILERVQAMRRLAADLRPQVPGIVASYREKLAKRMDDILQGADPERIHQEVALFAQKIDVDEELDRLLAHLDEIERVLNAGGQAGKRLDFLMQELNREANTLGSKSVTLEFSQSSVEFKVLIEQMREQVQNLE